MAAAKRKGLSVEDLMVFTATAAVVLSLIPQPSAPHRRSEAPFIAWCLLPIPVFATRWYRRARPVLVRRLGVRGTAPGDLDDEFEISSPFPKVEIQPRLFDELVGNLWDALGVIWIVASLLTLIPPVGEIIIGLGFMCLGTLATILLLSVLDRNALPFLLVGAYVIGGILVAVLTDQ
ncbi:hypothetical protein [Paludisphaera rhizosphaerae]|uniref:hypothetical protein n=1 Tax=Paludisphaera rhizosphaerae TaxID=2711216 RepID=UPI0013EC8958|nr:hypothetical protein [Paludisphaera rhizosphaerae]